MTEKKLTVYQLTNTGKLLKRYIAEAWPTYHDGGMREFRQAGTRKWVQLCGGGVTIVEETSDAPTKPVKAVSLIEVCVLSDAGELLAVYRTNNWPTYSSSTKLEFIRTDNGLWVQIAGSGNVIIEEVNVEAHLKAECQGILPLN